MKLTYVAPMALLIGAGCLQAQTPASSLTPDQKAAIHAVAKACKGQGKQLCPGKTGQEMAQCLKSNADKLTPDCKNAVSKVEKPSS
jgi:hypothetical protein